jgi:hypothetical protein
VKMGMCDEVGMRLCWAKKKKADRSKWGVISDKL